MEEGGGRVEEGKSPKMSEVKGLSWWTKKNNKQIKKRYPLLKRCAPFLCPWHGAYAEQLERRVR